MCLCVLPVSTHTTLYMLFPHYKPETAPSETENDPIYSNTFMTEIYWTQNPHNEPYKQGRHHYDNVEILAIQSFYLVTQFSLILTKFLNA